MAGGDGLFGFNPDSGTFELMVMQQGVLSGWPSSGSFIARRGGFTAGNLTTMVKAGQQTELDILIISNGVDNVFAMYQDHTFHDLLNNQYYSCPKTKSLTYYGDRLWALKNNYLAFSDAFPATYYPTVSKIVGDQTTYSFSSGDTIKVTIDSVVTDDISLSGASTIAGVAALINTACSGTYASVGVYPDAVGVLVITSPTVGTSSNTAIADGTNSSQTCVGKLFASASKSSNGYAPFDLVTNVFRMPVGEDRGLIGTRDQGIIAMGIDQIWQLSPSSVPDPTTDQPQKVLDIGCIAINTAVQVADDIMFLAYDGVRGLFRTQLDKLQTGQSFPLSYPLANEFNEINWVAIDKACAVYYQNKYIIALPTNGSSYNNVCWVYYPALSTAFYASTNESNIAATKSWVIYKGWNISDFATLEVNGQLNLYGTDAVTGEVYQLYKGTTDNGNTIVYDEQSKAEDFKAPMQHKFGGEYKVRAMGGNGTLIISANADNLGWLQLGSMSLTTTGVGFPTSFPVNFSSSTEAYGVFHLDSAGIIKFKRCQFEINSNTNSADITILETVATAFQEPYLSEDT